LQVFIADLGLQVERGGKEQAVSIDNMAAAASCMR
jgi:hypothetical protein